MGASTAADASALHRVLRYPTAKQLAARQSQPFRVVIKGGSYSSIPVGLPNNTHLTVRSGGLNHSYDDENSPPYESDGHPYWNDFEHFWQIRSNLMFELLIDRSVPLFPRRVEQ